MKSIYKNMLQALRCEIILLLMLVYLACTLLSIAINVIAIGGYIHAFDELLFWGVIHHQLPSAKELLLGTLPPEIVAILIYTPYYFFYKRHVLALYKLVFIAIDEEDPEAFAYHANDVIQLMKHDIKKSILMRLLKADEINPNNLKRMITAYEKSKYMQTKVDVDKLMKTVAQKYGTQEDDSEPPIFKI